MDERVLLVDLCGTLYDSNTTFDFLQYFLAESNDYVAFETSANSLPGRVCNRLLPGDRRRARAIGYLEGFSREKLNEAASVFLERVRPIQDVRRFLESERAAHDRTVIVSSSLDFIVESACNLLEFDGWFATTLSYTAEKCDGVILDDLMGRKDKVITGEFASAECTLLTDNHDDLPCRRLVQRFIGVAQAEDRRAMSFWSNRVSEVVAYRK